MDNDERALMPSLPSAAALQDAVALPDAAALLSAALLPRPAPLSSAAVTGLSVCSAQDHGLQDELLVPVVALAPESPAFTPNAKSRVKPRAKGKTKAKSKQLRRFKWANTKVAELLRLRFADGAVKRRLETADTKVKTALAWQLFASILSQSIGVVITHAQVHTAFY